MQKIVNKVTRIESATAFLGLLVSALLLWFLLSHPQDESVRSCDYQIRCEE